MGLEALESQLQTAATTERQGQDFRLTRLISQVREREGRPAVVVEVTEIYIPPPPPPRCRPLRTEKGSDLCLKGS